MTSPRDDQAVNPPTDEQVEDLQPKLTEADAQAVRGGDGSSKDATAFTIKKTTDTSSPILF